MDDENRPDLAAVAAFADRAGLTGLTIAELERFAFLAERVAGQAASVGRVPRKSDEPAHVFRVDVARSRERQEATWTSRPASRS